MSVLDVDVADGVATITLNRPDKRNAMDPEMVVRLADAWHRVREDDGVRVAILTGAGPETFSAGGDLRRLITLLTRARPAEDEWDERLLADQRGVMNSAMLRVPSFPKPIVAAVNGLCFAGGLELALAADLRVVADHARLALSEVQRGLIPGGGSVARLPRMVPAPIARELLLLGEPVTAARAYDVGLVNAVVQGPEVLPRARAMADRIARNAPLAVAAVREAVAEAPGVGLEEAFRREDEAVRRIMRSADAREGARAFAERRDPRYTGT
ncbi:enoyl-CoA hydratase/isomerase family protein [Pseudonocardia halophobica]|uniref:enoyl-CoA hydratase/isomerase family protein n=1 Tax=Pseudonocardia halophobica TaxID=29401 RepID=UPI003D92F618